MTFQEVLRHRHAPIVLGGVIALLFVIILWQLLATSPGAPGQRKVDTYSDDDGATYFEDAAGKITPFDHNGKQAVLASLSKGPDGKMRVGYLARHTETARNLMEQARAKGERFEGARPFMEFKKPGAPANAWVPDTDPRSEEIRK